MATKKKAATTKKAGAKTTTKPTKALLVADHLDILKHPLKAEIVALRAIVLGARPGITEHIKWNAPSFCFGGDDRVTMRLQPKLLQLIFHRGAKPKDTKTFKFVDDTGLLKMITVDRGVVAFADMAEVKRRKASLAKLVSRWMEATRVDASGTGPPSAGRARG